MKRLLIPFIALALCPPAQAVPETKHPNRHSAISDCLNKAYWRPGIWIESEKFVDARCVLDPKKKMVIMRQIPAVKNVLSGRKFASYKAKDLSCGPQGSEQILKQLSSTCAFWYTSPHGPVIERFTWVTK